VVWQGDYDPFGQATETVATIEQNLRFPGQYLDRESGLHYNYFRTYDPIVGRYTQPDPLGVILRAAGPQTSMWLPGVNGVFYAKTAIFTELNNLYGYASQNPVKFIDSSGLAPISIQFYIPEIGKESSGDSLCLAGDDCEEEISACRDICQLARFDGDMVGIWGGSYAQCMLGCVSWRCMDQLPSF
jgi:RHS repeat-associated protein